MWEALVIVGASQASVKSVGQAVRKGRQLFLSRS